MLNDDLLFFLKASGPRPQAHSDPEYPKPRNPIDAKLQTVNPAHTPGPTGAGLQPGHKSRKVDES